MFNKAFHEEIPLLWPWAFVYRSSQSHSTPSYLQPALQHPLQCGESALLSCHHSGQSSAAGPSPKAQLPSLSWDVPQLPWHLRCPWFLLQEALCPCLLCFTAMPVTSGSSNHKLSSNFIVPTAPFCCQVRFPFIFLKDQPLWSEV